MGSPKQRARSKRGSRHWRPASPGPYRRLSRPRWPRRSSTVPWPCTSGPAPPGWRGVPGCCGRPPWRPSWRRACRPGRGSRPAASRRPGGARRSTGFWPRRGGDRRTVGLADNPHLGEFSNIGESLLPLASPHHTKSTHAPCLLSTPVTGAVSSALFGTMCERTMDGNHPGLPGHFSR